MSDYNLQAKSRNMNERRVAISVDNCDAMWDWLKHFESKYNPPESPARDMAKERLEEYGPVTKVACEIWIMVAELKQIEMWHKYYAKDNQETEMDRATIAIIDQALNPKPKEKK